MVQSPIIVPKVAEGFVSHQSNLGVDSYDLNELYSPDTEFWKSKVLDLGSPKYPPQAAAAPTRYWFDKSRYRNHGTITGATWQQLPSGVYALNFDGSDDVVSCGSGASLANLAAMTLKAWIKPRTTGRGGVGRIFNKATAGVTAGWLLSVYPDNNYFLMVDHATTDLNVYTSNNTLVLNSLTQVVLTWDGSLTAANVHIYLNGKETTYKTQTNGVGARVDDATTALTIGAISTISGNFDGLIILPRVLNAVLSASQIDSDYQREKEMLGV